MTSLLINSNIHNSSNNNNSTIVPPINFSMVATGVYRSGYPNKRNHLFLSRLQLKTIIYLCPDEITPEHQEFIKSLQFFHLPMQGNKEPFTSMDKQTISKVLELVLDSTNHPVLIHCNKGKHRVGTVMGILRKLQNWSLTSIFDEYRRFAGTKARISDMELIELFDGPIQYNYDKRPNWL